MLYSPMEPQLSQGISSSFRPREMRFTLIQASGRAQGSHTAYSRFSNIKLWEAKASRVPAEDMAAWELAHHLKTLTALIRLLIKISTVQQMFKFAVLHIPNSASFFDSSLFFNVSFQLPLKYSLLKCVISFLAGLSLACCLFKDILR